MPNEHPQVDRKRVYSVGMSNGGFMSIRLGCEASDVFAAVASVTGVLGNVSPRAIPPPSVDSGPSLTVLTSQWHRYPAYTTSFNTNLVTENIAESPPYGPPFRTLLRRRRSSASTQGGLSPTCTFTAQATTRSRMRATQLQVSSRHPRPSGR